MKLAVLVLIAVTLWPPPPAGAEMRMQALNPQTARLIAGVVRAADRRFPRVPAVTLTSRIADLCGGDHDTSTFVRYCVRQNAIFVAADLDQRLPDAAAAYVVAHAYGHAIQVRYGLADRALAAIRADRSRERALRAMVTSQVECLAGLLVGAALPDLRQGLPDWFTAEPFTGSHWGGGALAQGPKVSIGLETRDRWFRTGLRAGAVQSCAVGEMGVDLLPGG